MSGGLGPLCRFAGLLGEPGKGMHSFRVGGVAAVDVVLTALLAFFLARRKGHATLGLFVAYFILLVLLSVLIHAAFCVNTRLNAFLFGDPWPTAGPSKRDLATFYQDA
jgi:hypothetical protein